MCDRKNGDGTPCLDRSKYQLGFTFGAVSGGPGRAEVQSTLKVCEYHKKYANVSDIIDVRMIEAIQEVLKRTGHAPADPKSFELTFTPLA